MLSNLLETANITESAVPCRHLYCGIPFLSLIFSPILSIHGNKIKCKIEEDLKQLWHLNGKLGQE